MTSNITKQISDLLAENQRLQEIIESERSKTESLRLELKNERKLKDTFSRTVSQLRHFNGTLKASNDDAKAEIKSLNTRFQHFFGMSKKFDLERERLKKELDTVRRECARLKSEICEMKECQICREPFDHENHQPAKAKCGHILYCQLCLFIIGDTTGKCPSCREPFNVFDVVSVNLSFI